LFHHSIKTVIRGNVNAMVIDITITTAKEVRTIKRKSNIKKSRED
jgi:hypothetical protein